MVGLWKQYGVEAPGESAPIHLKKKVPSRVKRFLVSVVLVYDDVGLNILGGVADILGTNCNKLLKLTINQCEFWGGGVGVGGGGGGGGEEGRRSLQLQYM